jgi:hypothetical protein
VLNAKNNIIINRNIGLAIASALNKKMYSFGYNNTVSATKLEKIKIKMPTKGEEIDLDFIENYIGELEEKQIQKLEAYLSVNGYKNYTLSTDEQKVLLDFEQGNIEFSEFKIGDLFEVNSSKKRFDANKVVISESGNPYVVRTSLNNGVRGYISEDEQYLNKGNTISFGQDTATMFYQEKPYFTGDKIKIIKSKDSNFNKSNALFFVTAMTKCFSSFSWGGSSFNVRIIKNQLVKLPVLNNKPNYELIETLTSAIQKLVIKDVVLYTNSKIETIKSIENQKA